MKEMDSDGTKIASAARTLAGFGKGWKGVVAIGWGSTVIAVLIKRSATACTRSSSCVSKTQA